ncbi:hypothetical protein [Actibacterium sp. D379-3]
MLSASSLLIKVIRLKREAVANRPVDPLACLSVDQRQYLKKWCEKLHSETGDDAYAALLNMTHWTPFDWLQTPMVTQDLSEEFASQVYSDFRDVAK